MRRSVYILFLFSLIILSCAKVVDTGRRSFDSSKTYAVVPFENYSDTPLAGYSVASIVEGILRAKGFRVSERVWNYKSTDPTSEELSEILKKAKDNADYVIYGTVNEYRYKTGIDGEPAVSITVYVIETSTDKVVYGASLSSTGWAHESLGTVTQKLLRGVFQ
ncbi:hypothetical protein BCF55_0378 [Hydrogenivirga caldilitoris]|uniref:Lipoprotein n=1 Tax=Hydrogenivirga caldilitoris TaxID=246264 RepID=A0A497XP88_9AQUI|nr:DUF4136 domain-containing protein [Hydrogenivirga caldilitoris]RLJ70114.1 hypothetical protein BCF55_0378 [Hydrogenivirga caldilitoris]